MSKYQHTRTKSSKSSKGLHDDSSREEILTIISSEKLY